MPNDWDGKDLKLEMAGRSRVSRALNAFIFIKKSRPIRRLLAATPAWLTPNAVTWARLGLCAPVLVLLLREQWWWGLGLTALSFFLDFIDGALAEAKNLKTRLGAIIDPLIDKVSVITVFGALIPHLPVWIGVLSGLMIAIEFVIGTQRLLALRPGVDAGAAKRVTIAAWPGKLKMVAESVALGVLILGMGLASPVTLAIGGLLLLIAVPSGMMSVYTKFVA